jgi:hypothetical protein
MTWPNQGTSPIDCSVIVTACSRSASKSFEILRFFSYLTALASGPEDKEKRAIVVPTPVVWETDSEPETDAEDPPDHEGMYSVCSFLT